MNLQQFNLTFTSILDFAAGLAFPGGLAFAGGYFIYGNIFDTNKSVTGLAFTISVWTHALFQTLVHYETGGEKKNPKAFCAAQLIGTNALGAAQILIYRKLNIISMVGTLIFLSFMTVGSLTYVNKLARIRKNEFLY